MVSVQRSARETFGTKEELANYLERAIREGELMPGDRLPSERQLGLEYKVSRPVVREALRGLSERGYIEVYPGRGSFVRAPDAGDLSRPLVRIATSAGVTSRNLVEAREMLECAAVRAAAVNADDEQIVALGEALRAHHDAKTLNSRAATDLAFHTMIAGLSGNPVIGLMYGSIKGFLQGLMLRSHSDPTVHTAGDPLHQEVFQCIRDRDPDGAEAAMRTHIALALELFGDDLDRPLAEVLADRGIHLAELV